MTEWLLLALFPLLMAYAAVSDLLSMTISNKVCLLLLIGFGVVAIASGVSWADLGWHFAAGFLVLSVTFGMFAAGWIGGGDAKLAAVTALWLGWGSLLEYGIWSSLFGGVLTLVLLQFRMIPLPLFTTRFPWLLNLHHKDTGVPYGIALAAAALVVYPESGLWRAAFNV